VSGLPAAVSRLRGTIDVVYREMLKFGTVGAVAFVVDVGLFNLLTSDLWFGSGAPPLDGHEKMAKIVSAGTATVVAWLGNRYWSFRHRRQASRGKEFLTFVVMNVIATGIAVLCLAVSHDLLGFTSKLADNLSGNVIGVALGTLFRFWAYRTFVFTDFLNADGRDRAAADAALELPAAAEDDAGPPVTLESRRIDGRLTPAQGLPRVVAVPESKRRAAG
jgi:putative flippase GtrA